MSWKTVGLRRMCLDWLKDPQRRKHVCWRSAQCLAGWMAGWFTLLVLAKSWLWQANGLGVANFLVFEFVLEPLGLLGPYWEGGPEDGKPYTHW